MTLRLIWILACALTAMPLAAQDGKPQVPELRLNDEGTMSLGLDASAYDGGWSGFDMGSGEDWRLPVGVNLRYGLGRNGRLTFFAGADVGSYFDAMTDGTARNALGSAEPDPMAGVSFRFDF